MVTVVSHISCRQLFRTGAKALKAVRANNNL